jgi:ABC-type phosphate transport system substrate-binding protein
LKIRADKASAAVDPSATNIRSRVYPISRYVYWYVPVNANSAVKAFCAWSLSSEGQLVVESVGFQPLMPADRLEGLNRLNIAKSAAGAGSR